MIRLGASLYDGVVVERHIVQLYVAVPRQGRSLEERNWVRGAAKAGLIGKIVHHVVVKAVVVSFQRKRAVAIGDIRELERLGSLSSGVVAEWDVRNSTVGTHIRCAICLALGRHQYHCSDLAESFPDVLKNVSFDQRALAVLKQVPHWRELDPPNGTVKLGRALLSVSYYPTFCSFVTIPEA